VSVFRIFEAAFQNSSFYYFWISLRKHIYSSILKCKLNRNVQAGRQRELNLGSSAYMEAPDETEAEPMLHHASAENIHFGNGTLDESMILIWIIVLKKLLTDS
jgi:hypothetical protein